MGSGVLVAGLLTAGPKAGWPALPVLARLACPVLTLASMRGVRQGTGSAAAAPGGGPAARDGLAVAGRAAQITRLRRGIRQLKAHIGGVTLALVAAGLAAGAPGSAGRAGRAGRRTFAAGG